MSVWFTDPRTKRKSVSLTLLVHGFWTGLIRMLVSDVQIGDVKLGPFTGVDFAAVVGALGTLYGVRRYQDKVNDTEPAGESKDG